MIQWPTDYFADQFFANSLYVGKDERFKSLAIEVFERDKFTCQYCQFHCPPTPSVPTAYFQVKALDGNYRNLSKSNLCCVCPFCHSHFNLRASLKSGDYIPVKHSLIRPTQISILAKAIFAELSSKKNLLYDAANNLNKEIEGFSSNIILPDFTTLQFDAEEAGERARKARTSFILNIIALSDGGKFKPQTAVALQNVFPYPKWNSFSEMSDYIEKNSFSLIRKSQQLMNYYARM